MYKKFVAAALLAATSFGAHATVSVTLTADNHYGLFWGDAVGSALHFIGRNEVGPAGSSGAYNWSRPESWSFEADAGSYLYVVAWDAERQQSLIADVVTEDGSFSTNSNDWVFKLSKSGNPGDYGAVPDTAALQSLITDGPQWAAPAAAAANGAHPWGTIAGFSSAAQFIWADSLGFNSAADGGYVLFRTALPVVSQVLNPGGDIPAVPEPQSFAMLLAGLGVIGAIARRRLGR